MGKIVVNKHSDIKANVTPESFVHKGEIIISNQVGYEGIFITNKNGDMLFIGPTEGNGSEIPTEYKEYIESYVNGALDTAFDGYLTSGETIALIKASATSESINEEEIKGIISGEMQTVLSVYFTSAQTEEYINARLEDYVTSAQVKDITAIEIAKIVDNAPENFDTLKEIADWIKNDTTGSAQMAIDITNLKGISADTRLNALEAMSADTRLDALEGLAHNHENLSVLSGISEEMVNSWNQSEENAKSYASAYTNSALTEYATKQYVKEAIKEATGSSTSSNFVFLSMEEYEILTTSGSVTTNRQETIVYDENTYYALYDEDTPNV